MPPYRLRHLHVDGIRSFEDFHVDFTGADGGTRAVTLAIGKNGTNKTTLLRCLAIALSDAPDAVALLTQPVGSWVAEGRRNAVIEVLLEGDHDTWTIRAVVEREDDRETIVERSGPAPSKLGIFVAGYGAGRARVGSDFGSGSGRGYRSFDSVLSLFDYGTELTDPELALRRLADYLREPAYHGVLDGVRAVLGLGSADEFRIARGGGVEITGPSVGGDAVPLEAWADGYRLTVLWLLDLYTRALVADAIDLGTGTVRGVVLVDEVDQHLHPALQAGLVRSLHRLLPHAQLVLTTHSPLVALDADPSELVVLRRRGAYVEVDQDVPNYRGWTVEDMLVDEELFDSAAAPEATRVVADRYRSLVAKGPNGRTPDEDSELRALVADRRSAPLPPGIADPVATALEEITRSLGGADAG